MNDTKRTSPSPGADEDAVRLRAYELWERGGRRHGEDRENWLAAEASLKPPGFSANGSASSISDAAKGVIADGIQSATTLATGAITAVAGLFGAQPTKQSESAPVEATRTGKAAPANDVEPPALAKQEKAVLLTQDKRIHDAKVAAEATKMAKPKGPVNPDG